ncbi:MAG: hypothetical protein ACODAQ_02225 [Phycisphaeraceae bacterium]
MYELKCPSCAQTESASFVRIGAVVTCAGCGETYRVDESHVTHRSPLAPEDVAAAESRTDDAAAPTDTAGEDEQEESTDLSGLFEALEQAQAAEAPAEEIVETPAEGRATSRRASQARGRRLQRWALAGAGGVAVVLLLLTFYLTDWFMPATSSSATMPPEDRSASADGDPAGRGQTTDPRGGSTASTDETPQMPEAQWLERAPVQLTGAAAQMRRISGLLRQYFDEHERFPDDLAELAPYLPADEFDQLLTHPETHDWPGYIYEKPAEDADPRTTPILWEARAGARYLDGIILYGDGRIEIP